MKRFVIIVFAMVMTMAMIFPNGTEESVATTSNGPTKFTWWCISSQADFYKARANEWNKQYPDRQIDLDAVGVGGSDRQTKLLVAIQTGKGAPDFCDVNVTAFGTFFDYDEIPFVDLTDLVSQDKDKFVQAKLNIYSTKGKLYGAPSQLGGTVVYYNTDIMSAAGVNYNAIKTWADYEQAGKAVLEKTGKPMTVIETTDMAPFQSMVLQKGSDFIDKDGKVILDCDANIEILKYLKGWVDKGIASPMPGGGNASEVFYEFFNKGGCASIILPMWYMDRLQKYMPDLSGKIAVRPMPVWNTEQKWTTACTGGNGAVISKQCKNQGLAKDFLFYCKMSKDAQIQCYRMLGYDPYRIDCWEDPMLQVQLPYFCNENVFAIVGPSLKDANAINNTSLVPTVFNEVSSKVMYNVFETKTQTPEEALQISAQTLRTK